MIQNDEKSRTSYIKALMCIMARVQQQNRKLWFLDYCGFVYEGTITNYGMLMGFIIVQTML